MSNWISDQANCRYCGEDALFSATKNSEEYEGYKYVECENCRKTVLWILTET